MNIHVYTNVYIWTYMSLYIYVCAFTFTYPYVDKRMCIYGICVDVWRHAGTAVASEVTQGLHWDTSSEETEIPTSAKTKRRKSSLKEI